MGTVSNDAVYREILRIQRFYQIRTVAREALHGTKIAQRFFVKLGVTIFTVGGSPRPLDDIARDTLDAWDRVEAGDRC